MCVGVFSFYPIVGIFGRPRVDNGAAKTHINARANGRNRCLFFSVATVSRFLVLCPVVAFLVLYQLCHTWGSLQGKSKRMACMPWCASAMSLSSRTLLVLVFSQSSLKRPNIKTNSLLENVLVFSMVLISAA